MRRMLQGRAGTGLAFILGLLIATAGTATAAKLITGKQIKDGSISSKDLSKAVQAQLAKAGMSGPKGDAGSRGDVGSRGDPGAKGDPGPAATALAWSASFSASPPPAGEPLAKIGGVQLNGRCQSGPSSFLRVQLVYQGQASDAGSLLRASFDQSKGSALTSIASGAREHYVIGKGNTANLIVGEALFDSTTSDVGRVHGQLVITTPDRIITVVYAGEAVEGQGCEIRGTAVEAKT